ncbi:hypothetical protein HPB48_008053 [Haemaphysalis longicornis]|uniref:Nuclease HARBI1 n=1 Tax=Haemaphysalis longicornis TaxID=44386 RepID=A0A9J6G0P1_HAELO|nr:hypothetical protein HPB48_008053 [Haemaphysalis longicornis]
MGDLIKVSQPTVCRTVRKVTELIPSHLFERLVHFPEAAALTKVMRDFYNIAQFPGVTGCIDCAHIEINSPGGDNAEVYRYRKGYFSINMQVSDRLCAVENPIRPALGTPINTLRLSC